MSVTDIKRLHVALSVISMAVLMCWLIWPEKERLLYLEKTARLTFTYVNRIVDVSEVKSPPKRILYWGYYFNIQWRDSGYWPFRNISCYEGVECLFTDDEQDYVSSDAVIFHSRTKPKALPSASIRPPEQVWVFMTLEAPPYVGAFYSEKSIINWTMTYLRTSDIHPYYGKILPGRFNGGFNSSRNYLEGKNQSVVAVISNCISKRLEFVNELSRFIDVDMFGKCGKQELCQDCWEKLQHYKFYLSFENSICFDYVTEKFYENGLMSGLVPVVLGGANYSDPSVAPPGSYINVRDFASIKELAEFLKRVGSDPQLYSQYFQWYSHYEVADMSRATCELCARLYQSKTTKVYEDVLQWYKTEGHCEEYPDVPQT